MTFNEISDYLYRTSFSDDTIKIIERCICSKIKQYYKALKCWLRNPKKEKFKIFRPITYKGKNDETLIVVPHSDENRHIDFVAFVKFMYRNSKYVAFKRSDSKRCVYFSWHSLRRYAERFLKDKDAKIDDVFIGKFLTYNASGYIPNVGEKDNMMYVIRDGSFLGEMYGGDVIAKTFISEAEYFDNQRKIDAEAFKQIKIHYLFKWNVIIDRRV